MTIQANFPAIKPSLMLDFANTKQLDSRITYTRASTASYYDGVTTSKAEENYVLYSQEFDNAYWTKSNATITANSTTAPDATTTADTLTDDSASNFHTAYRSVTSVVAGDIVASIYMKQGTAQYGCVSVASDTSPTWRYGLIVNLATGAVTDTNSTGTLPTTTNTVTSVGNGWYRISIKTASYVGGTYALLAATSNSATPTWSISLPTYVGSGSTVFIWGAQLEQRSAVSAYTATTTQAITNYIPVLQTAASGVARFDNNPTTGESLGLLIEESRTNLLTYSSQFDNAAWSKVNATITADTIVSPDGTLNGDKLIGSGSGSLQHYVQRTLSLTGTNTLTVYAKAGEKSFLLINIGGIGAWFNLSTGAIGTVDSGITAAITSVGNGWYRCSATRTATVADYYIYVVNSDNTFEFTGNSYDGIYIWGAQMEAGAFATSYIPTVASQVTRAADAASMTGTNFSTWFNAGQGSIYTDSLPIYATGSSRVLAFSDGTPSNRILIIASVANHLYVNSYGANVADLDGGSYSTTTTNRQGSAFAVNDFAVTINSGAMATDTLGAVPSGINRLYIGADSDGTSNLLNGTIKKVAYYPLRVTNAQLQALTS